MKVSVNKNFFLDHALPIIDLAAYGGMLAVASFGNTVNFRVPAYVMDPGQAFLSYAEWRDLVSEIQKEPGSMVEIEL